METFDRTTSFCPMCKKIVEAKISERNGAMFMEKTCPKHGDFESQIAKYAWYYKGLNGYYDILYGREDKNFDYQGNYICNVTSRCDLDCPICFAKPNKSTGIPIDFLKEELKKLKRKKVHFYLGGNESTEREDLPEILRIIKNSGHISVLLTHGLKFAENPGYLKVLKESGLNGIVTWIDSLKSPEVYKKMRGRDFSSQKMKALENIKKLKIAVQALQVLIKNFNEEEVGNLMNFCRKNDFINTFWVRGYQHMGRLGFSGEKEFLFDELIEIVADQSKGIYGIEDVYFFQKIIYAAGAVFGGRPTVPCYSTQLMVIPRHKEKSLNEIFNFKKFSKVLDEFGKVWQEDKGRAKRYFIKNYLPKLILNPKLNFLSLRQKFLGRQWNTFSRCPHYILVMTNVLPNILNFDIQRYKKQCKYRSFGPGEGNNFPDCYNYCLKYDTLYCNTA